MSTPTRAARAKLAAASRHHPNKDHSQLQRELAAAKLEAYVEKIVADAPPLTTEQRARLAALFTGTPTAATSAPAFTNVELPGLEAGKS
ncbi:hypothetical protein [Arthrobacter sp. Br18]|uniref:hypothetical protein n=1 Tax=Arthrobacter sp. Br18 TaxID=1312954 RepID=UPI0004B6B813|nr:hypothetical protein [Arthrobacter sp. Br18]